MPNVTDTMRIASFTHFDSITVKPVAPSAAAKTIALPVDRLVKSLEPNPVRDAIVNVRVVPDPVSRANAITRDELLGNLRAYLDAANERNLADPKVVPEDKAEVRHTETIDAELYKAGGPEMSDVTQGMVGDCWLLSSLAALVEKDPQAVKDMIRDNGDGTYSVRFYHDGNPTWITVDDDLARYFGDDEQYANAPDSDHDGRQEIWVAIVEKAFVRFVEQHYPDRGTGYAAIDGDTIELALESFNGKPCDGTPTSNTEETGASSAAPTATAWSARRRRETRRRPTTAAASSGRIVTR